MSARQMEQTGDACHSDRYNMLYDVHQWLSMLPETLTRLPAASLVTPLQDALVRNHVIIGAPPGAGKSTVLPLSLLQNKSGGKILLMQPRRVVVRNLAGYLASLCGEEPGGKVGYRIRGESQVGPNTQLEVITEGILARMIQSDPELTGVSTVIFDEFHERSIHSDFGLALALEVQQGLREDLRLLVMSATLETDAVRSLIPEATVLSTEGRTHPVELRYCGNVQAAALHDQVARQVRQAVTEHDGDVLVFLSGRGAIGRVSSQISDLAERYNIVVHTLSGSMDKAGQQAAILPDPQQRQKVILATNIAETSLTIEGVTVVIDSGMENEARFHPGSGLTTLSEQRISQASAVQRAGRAGRLQPGVCYRMWAETTQHRLARHPAPQILREDVTGLLLDALCWGSPLTDLPLLTQPTEAQLTVAMDSLTELGAVDDNGTVTRYGRALSALPCHPRLAHMLLQALNQAPSLNVPTLPAAAAWVAAASDEGLSGSSARLSDSLIKAPPPVIKRLRRQAERYCKQAGIPKHDLDAARQDSNALAMATALAYPQRVAYRRGSSYKLASGKGATLTGHPQADWLAVLDGQQIGSEFRIRLAEPIGEVQLRSLYPEAFSQRKVVRFNDERQCMEAREVTGFGNIDITSEPTGKVPAQAWRKAWLSWLSQREESAWPLGEAFWQWWHRVQLAASIELPQPQAYQSPDPWPVALDLLLPAITEHLAGRLGSCRTKDDLAALPWAQAAHQTLSWPQQQALDSLLPESLTVPSGQQHRCRYTADGTVVLAVRMGEMYGQTAPLTVAGGRVKVILELLSPARRPLQTTSNLEAFWQGSYREIQKEMKGRYPKHFWPDDPGSATPTTRTKKAMGR
ncbi:ATP-dependent helicase HrpB [Alteromonas sp. ASW11-19]|uniref:ATP-dependent helicase HrpB n=1 Tax=Alteromonas salexigens TaxID=2982530 RepID=A0ABT2VKM7_9ALTE|nr:ATP-dependent helicase HrpB [Alteromonas salexigens]MCU7553358.1 ATP-dependent helicase HrpB [Alteromonas salexigens]